MFSALCDWDNVIDGRGVSRNRQPANTALVLISADEFLKRYLLSEYICDPSAAIILNASVCGTTLISAAMLSPCLPNLVRMLFSPAFLV
jgi:hypothetical protein